MRHDSRYSERCGDKQDIIFALSGVTTPGGLEMYQTLRFISRFGSLGWAFFADTYHSE